MRADRAGARLRARRCAREKRAPRRAPGRPARGGRSIARALGAGPRRNAAEPRKLLRALRPSALARARGDAAERAPAEGSRSAPRRAGGRVDQKTAGDRGGGQSGLRDLPAALPLARIAARLGEAEAAESCAGRYGFNAITLPFFET